MCRFDNTRGARRLSGHMQGWGFTRRHRAFNDAGMEAVFLRYYTCARLPLELVVTTISTVGTLVFVASILERTALGCCKGNDDPAWFKAQHLARLFRSVQQAEGTQGIIQQAPTDGSNSLQCRATLYPCGASLITRVAYVAAHHHQMLELVFQDPSARLLVWQPFFLTQMLLVLLVLALTAACMSVVARNRRKLLSSTGSEAGRLGPSTKPPSTGSASTSASENRSGAAPVHASHDRAIVRLPGTFIPSWVVTLRNSVCPALGLMSKLGMLASEVLQPAPSELIQLSTSYPFSSASGSQFAVVLASLNLTLMVGTSHAACAAALGAAPRLATHPSLCAVLCRAALLLRCCCALLCVAVLYMCSAARCCCACTDHMRCGPFRACISWAVQQPWPCSMSACLST